MADSTKSPRLTILGGPLSGRELTLDEAVDNILIGSDSSCRFHLDTPGVSPIHARLWVDWQGVTVYDTGAPEGVYLNDDRVERSAPVRNGDILWLGPPGGAEVVNMQPPAALIKRGILSLPCIGDGRQSGTSGSPSILNASPEAAAGGPLALVREGDSITIDAHRLLHWAGLEAGRLDAAEQPIRFWANKYKTKFNEDPTVFSVYGYNAIDTFIQAAQKAGANLTVDSFIKAMETTKFPPDMFGSPEASFAPNKRAGSDMTRMSQLQNERWKVVTDYVKAQ